MQDEKKREGAREKNTGAGDKPRDFHSVGAGFRICFFSVMKSRLLASFSFCARVIFTLR